MTAALLGRSAESNQQQQQHAVAVPDDVPSLPIELLTLVFQGVPDSTLKQIRLCNSQFATAAAPLISCISFRQWLSKTISLRRLQHATHLHIDVKLTASSRTDADTSAAASCYGRGVMCPEEVWLQLQQLASQLPRLNSLHLPCWEIYSSSLPLPITAAAYLTALTRLDLQDLALLPAGLQLPRLKAASFSACDATVDLAAVAAFAPNLQQLRCTRLGLAPAAAAAAANTETAAADSVVAATAAGVAQAGQAAAAAAASSAHKLPLTMQECTHFGAQAVIVTGAASPAAAAAAFGTVFPILRVLFRVPQVSGTLTQDDESNRDAGYDELLEQLPCLEAIRGRNWFSSRSWFLIRGSETLDSEHWRKVKVMSFHSHSYPDGSSDFLDISKAPQLQHLRLTFNYPYTKADDLVRELQKLPLLSHLALPASLLCDRCCPEKHYPGLRQRLEGLVANTRVRKLQLLTLPAATTGLASFYCGHQESLRQGMIALRSKAKAMRCRGSAEAVTAAELRGGLLSQQLCLQQQQQQQEQLVDLELELVTENPEWADDSYTAGRDAGHPVWGVYVSRHEC